MKKSILLIPFVILLGCNSTNTDHTSTATVSDPATRAQEPMKTQPQYLFAVITVAQRFESEESYYINGVTGTVPITESDTIKYVSPIQEYEYLDRETAMKFIDYYEDRVRRTLDNQESLNSINSKKFYYTILDRAGRQMNSYTEASNIYHNEAGHIKHL